MQIAVKSVKIANGETIGYRESGSGHRVLLLVHGNLTSSRHLECLMSSFPAGFKLYAVDMRGFGNSSYNRRISSIRDLSEDIYQFADALNLKGFAIAGWSLGGAVVMQFASDHPDYVSRLILVGSVRTCGYQIYRKDENGFPIPGEPLGTREELAQDPIQMAPVIKAFARRDREFFRLLWDTFIYTHSRPSDEVYEEYLDDMLTQRNFIDSYYALAHFNISYLHNGVADGNGAVARIEMPTLIIHGLRDFVVPSGAAPETAMAIGPNARVELLDNCGHSPFVDDLDTMVRLISEFIAD